MSDAEVHTFCSSGTILFLCTLGTIIRVEEKYHLYADQNTLRITCKAIFFKRFLCIKSYLSQRQHAMSATYNLKNKQNFK